MIQMILGKPVSPLQVNPYEIIERKSVKRELRIRQICQFDRPAFVQYRQI